MCYVFVKPTYYRHVVDAAVAAAAAALPSCRVVFRPSFSLVWFFKALERLLG